MITEATVYWITRLDIIVVAGGVLFALSIMILLLLGFMLLMDDTGIMFEEPLRKTMGRIVKTCAVLAALSGLVLFFVPSTKEAVAIYIIPKIVNNEFVQETLPEEVGELYELAKGCLKSQIEVK